MAWMRQESSNGPRGKFKAWGLQTERLTRLDSARLGLPAKRNVPLGKSWQPGISMDDLRRMPDVYV